jgi:diguanylate cyclase (GGDEF)-like protein/PAS domain S-box-containing protein
MGKTDKQNKSGMGESAELAQALMRCAGTGIYVVQDGKFQYVNSLFQELTGYAERELRGMYSLDLVHPEDREAVRKKAIENLKDHCLLPYEYRFMKKNGEVMWVLERLVSTEYRGKRTAVGSFMDITERKRVEEALRQSEERYRTILEEMQDDYFEVDLAGNFMFVNEANARQLGYSREELIGMDYRVYIHPDDVENVYKTFNQVYREGQPIRACTFKIVRKDGSTGLGELSVFPLRNDKGEIIGFRGIGRDITERMQMIEALRRSEERYRTILAEIEEGYYEVDFAGNFTFVNNATCRQFGYSKEELIGMNYRVYVPKEDAKSVYKAWSKVYRTGKPLKSYPFVSIRKDGTEIFLENSVSPLRNNEGKIIGFRSISRDVTEHKQFEQKLAEMATHDPLTGLPNRVLLSDRFTMALALSRRSGNRLAVLMLDLDRFKTVNDSMGHDVGDQLLKAVGKRLRGILRKSDTIARIGGDEFILVLPQISQANDVVEFAQRILDAFQEPFVFDDHRINITTSIGIAVYPEGGKDIESLLKNADTAMYWAKEQGRDIYRFYDGEEAGTLLIKQVGV